MAPRLSKRQLREMAELAELSHNNKSLEGEEQEEGEGEGQGGEEENDDEEELKAEILMDNSRLNKSMFDALNDDNDIKDHSEEEIESEVEEVKQVKKSKNKKKKKKIPTTTITNSIDPIPAPTSTSTSTPSKKSTTSKSNTPQTNQSEEMDEIDLALLAIAKKSGINVEELETVASTSSTSNPSRNLLPKWKAVQEAFQFDPKFLDPEVELRKMFGSKVVNSTPVVVARSRHHARLANNPHHAVSMKRTASYLATPEAGWTPPKGVVTLIAYTGPEAKTEIGEGDWFTFEHSIEYRESQLKFLEVLQQADGNRLYHVLESNPYHIDTLMQLSEMMVQQGDLDLSSKHLSKALYALSTPLPPSFLNGSFRLPYSQIENRSFFLGVYRKVALLTKRGTWRTAFEWSKIGLGVGGESDPVGMLLFIDFLAPKAKQSTWFVNTIEALNIAYPEMKVHNYPGLAYAKALCLRNLEEENSEDDTKSTAALRTAILKFPMVAYLLYASLGGNMPPQLVSNRRSQVDGAFTSNPSYLLSLQSTLYSVRSSPIWKEPRILKWLQKTTEATASSLDDSSEDDVRIGEKLWSVGGWPKGVAPSGVIRGAFLSEIPSVKPYLPPSATSSTSYSYDPLPPTQPYATFYNEKYFSPLHSSRSRRSDTNNNQQQQAARGIPGGAMAQAMRAQLANMLGFNGNAPVPMTDDLRAELMRDLEMLDDAQGGAPGGFPGLENDEGDDEEDEEGEEEGNNVDAVGPEDGLFRRFTAMLRGRQPEA